jgi:plastocyanin
MSRLHTATVSLFALAGVLCVAAAQAGTMQITVTDKDGKPAQDVVVLVDSASKVTPKASAAPVVVAQENLHYAPFLTVVPVGSTVRFVNRDSYDHHVRSVPSGPLGSMPSVKSFEFRLDAANEAASSNDEYKTAAPKGKKSGTTWAEVKVDQAGPIGLGCHLHSSMRGQIYVSGTPFYAKTDTNGVATIEGIPDGAAEIALWHPDQLQEQAVLRVQVSASPLKAIGQLNFTPRRRRS